MPENRRQLLSPVSIHTTSEAGRLFVINPCTLPGEVEMDSDDDCAMALITLIYLKRKLELEKRADKKTQMSKYSY